MCALLSVLIKAKPDSDFRLLQPLLMMERDVLNLPSYRMVILTMTMTHAKDPL